MQAASVAHRHGSVPLLCVLHALTGIVHAARAEAPAPFRFPARTIASHNTMSAKGMGDKRPAAIASVGDAASGAKAAMRTPYGRLRNRARTRTVRPPRPVRSTVILKYGRGGAPDSSCTACAQASADPVTRCRPRFGLLAARKDARRALLCSRLPERRSHAAARFARSMRSRTAVKYGDGAVCAPYSFPDGHHPARNLRSGGAGEGAQLSGTTSSLYENYSLNASLTNSC